MESENNEELELFREICIDNDSDSDNYFSGSSIFGKPPPPAPLQPPATEKYINFEEYIKEKCENKLKVLDRSTFHQIQRPIIISFNHFREKCYYHTKWLDRLYQLSLKYGDQIEFIVADQVDIDLMYPHRNPIGFFCFLVRPEAESPSMYAIDEKKRIHEHFDAYKTIESLSELCEKLLSGNLYLSQPIPGNNDTLVKISVHQNYDELVTKSTKDVLLIVGLGDYRPNEEYEPNYEEIAKELKDSNVDIVYIDGDKNYVPFKFNANSYPTILFIPYNDRENFIHYNRGPRDTENVMGFIKDNIGPQGASWRQKEILKLQYKPFTLPEDRELNIEDLDQYINEHFPESLKVLNRNTFNTAKKCIIIYFMDFRGKGVAFYGQTLKLIYQVAQATSFYGVEYLIADLKDIDVIYPKWYSKYVNDSDIVRTSPQVFAIDRMKHTYKVDEFQTASSLFYYSYRLNYSLVFHSTSWSISNNNDLVTTCVGQNLSMFIKKSKTDIFLTVYWGSYKGSFKILKALSEIADEVRSMNVKLIKIDAKLNYIPLEYSHTVYPVHFFIPHRCKDMGTVRYISSNQSKEEILEFIRTSKNSSA